MDWSEEFSVGIPEIDAQHKVLLDILNALNRAGQDSRSVRRTRNLLWDKLEELNEYAAFHFMTEEKLMREHLPADASMARHVAEHRQYWVSISDFKQRASDHEAQTLPALTDFLNR